MTDLSPAAQAVRDAALATYDKSIPKDDSLWALDRASVAAALRAAAEQVGQTPADLGNPEWKEGVLLAYRYLLAIAAELEGME
jgi:hypothetical protein